MVQPYLDTLQTLVACEFAEVSRSMCKHFFSSAALYANNTIYASHTRAGFTCKLPKQRCSERIQAGTIPLLCYFDNSPIKKGYALFPDNN